MKVIPGGTWQGVIKCMFFFYDLMSLVFFSPTFPLFYYPQIWGSIYCAIVMTDGFNPSCDEWEWIQCSF